MCLATVLKEQEEKNERERSAISLTKSYLYNREGNNEASALIFPIPFKALFSGVIVVSFMSFFHLEDTQNKLLYFIVH